MRIGYGEFERMAFHLWTELEMSGHMAQQLLCERYHGSPHISNDYGERLRVWRVSKRVSIGRIGNVLP